MLKSVKFFCNFIFIYIKIFSKYFFSPPEKLKFLNYIVLGKNHKVKFSILLKSFYFNICNVIYNNLQNAQIFPLFLINHRRLHFKFDIKITLSVRPSVRQSLIHILRLQLQHFNEVLIKILNFCIFAISQTSHPYPYFILLLTYFLFRSF